MERKEIEQRWRELSEDVISGMADWRVAHPRATLREIELEIDQHLDRLRARMIEDAALVSVRADWRQSAASEVPQCPACGQRLQSAGKRRRCLQTRGKQEVTLTRQYGVCPACGRGSFPPG